MMTAPVINRRICTAALWDRCRCVKCNPSAEGATTGAPDAAAARLSGPFPSGGGTPHRTSGDLAVPPEHPAAARHPSRKCTLGGGLFGDAL